MRQKRKASAFDDDDGSKASIIRRRRKTDLQISVNGTAAHIHAGQMQIMAPPNGTPYRGYGYVQGVHGTVSPLIVDAQAVYGDDLYNNGLGSLGNLISLPISDTPGKPFANGNGEVGGNSSSSSSSSSSGTGGTPKFDFDEVVQHFPSPRAGGMLGSSPSRWSIGSAGSAGSFAFPDSHGKMRDSMGSMGPGSDGNGLSSSYMMASNSTTKILRRQSGMSDMSDSGGTDSMRLPSPMSALPSPTFADISVSFLNAQQQLERVGGIDASMQSPMVKGSNHGSSSDAHHAIVSSDDTNKSNDSGSCESADGSTSGLST